VVTVGWDFDRETLTVSVVPGASAVATPSLAGPILTLIDQPIASPVDMTNSALKIAHELRTKLNNRLTGSGTAIGDPRIRAGKVIRLEGLGPDFSGDYRITNADHSIGGDGYRTHFKVRKEIIP
jgi:phage protein D